MSTLGKVLAILNLLAAIALGALLAKDYGKRQSWAYAVFRYDLALKGLPLDDQQLGRDGQPLVNDLGSQTLQELFSQAGSQPVKTQIEEVAEVEKKVRSKIQEVGEDKAKQAAATARYLIPLAATNSQREDYRACRTHLAAEASIQQLKAQLEAAFQWSVEIRRRDARKRTFPEAFDEGLRWVRGEATQPFARAFVKALSREPDKVDAVFQNTFKGVPPNPTPQQLTAASLQILQGLRGQPGDWQELMTATFKEVIDSVQADLQGQLDNAFKEAQTGERTAATGETKKSDPGEQRQIIAHLMFALLEPLVEDEAAGQEGAKAEWEQSPAFRRFLTVVGMENAVRAINLNAQTLARITYELGVEIDRERGDFVVAQQDFLAVLQDQASRSEALRALLEHKRNQLAVQQDLIRRRQAEITRLEGEIATARQATAARREELKKMSQGLFDLRLQLRDATTKNQELEKSIGALEQGR